MGIFVLIFLTEISVRSDEFYFFLNMVFILFHINRPRNSRLYYYHRVRLKTLNTFSHLFHSSVEGQTRITVGTLNPHIANLETEALVITPEDYVIHQKYDTYALALLKLPSPLNFSGKILI